MIDLEKLSKEHEKLFPNASAESQFHKMEEEIQEYLEASEDDIKELADIIIVCAGLYRWMPKTAQSIADYFCLNWSLIPYSMKKRIGICQNDILASALNDEVNRKWEVNKKRKWVWNGKTYHHEGNDE